MHKDQKTSKNLNYYLVKIQKPLVLSLFAIMVIAFVYALIYMTPFFDIYQLETYIKKADAVFYGVDFSIFENNFWTDGSLKCSRKHQKCYRHVLKYMDNASISCLKRCPPK